MELLNARPRMLVPSFPLRADDPVMCSRPAILYLALAIAPRLAEVLNKGDYVPGHVVKWPRSIDHEKVAHVLTQLQVFLASVFQKTNGSFPLAREQHLGRRVQEDDQIGLRIKALEQKSVDLASNAPVLAAIGDVVSVIVKEKMAIEKHHVPATPVMPGHNLAKPFLAQLIDQPQHRFKLEGRALYQALRTRRRSRAIGRTAHYRPFAQDALYLQQQPRCRENQIARVQVDPHVNIFDQFRQIFL